ncbi:MAG: multifunctional CCA tRNA nucleotidyl transferase/2'3'-cyclic phosphodiesterase/2'nucleotidase/phosphatase [Pseudomonadota bacterium]|nr:multifunctional CCA tRNA nucleotidyl transferase/2'3'-cyclic phosphodiesterase/2'nucleotidase/phosphatase [Pseudomonadota bacterium]
MQKFISSTDPLNQLDAEVYLVGGAVRDELLGLEIRERDWVIVGGSAKQLLDLGFQQVGQDFPVFLHPQTQEEYALARTERKQGKGYHGFSVSTEQVTLEEDLLRRDLTINAIAKSTDGALIDPYGGQTDLQQRLFRHVSLAFTEDPLRVLRIARFYARFYDLGFQLTPETRELLESMVQSGELEQLTPERVWQETARALMSAHPEQYVTFLLGIDAWPILFPALDNIKTDAPAFSSLMASLRLAAKTALPLESRMALLFVSAMTNNSSAVDQLSSSLKLPNRVSKMCRLVQHYFPALCQPCEHWSSEQILSCFQQCQAFQQQDTFRQLCDALTVLSQCFDQPFNSIRLNQCLDKTLTISASELIKKGFSGKELGEKIHAERCRAIQEVLESTPL